MFAISLIDSIISCIWFDAPMAKLQKLSLEMNLGHL
jgi:hypothetical protein